MTKAWARGVCLRWVGEQRGRGWTLSGRMLGVVLLAFVSTAPSARPEGPERANLFDEPFVKIGPEQRHAVLDLPESVRGLVSRRRWSQAGEALLELGPDPFVGSTRAGWAFLTAWSLLRSERADEAWGLVPLFEGSEIVPSSYVDLLKGEILLARDQPLEAIEVLGRVAPSTDERVDRAGDRAALKRAMALDDLGRTREALEAYISLTQRSSDVDVPPEALLAVGLKLGPGSDSAYPYLRRVWVAHPLSHSAAVAASHLARYTGAEHRPTLDEVGRRAEHLMYAGDYGAATRLLEGWSTDGGSIAACRAVFVRGRSEYRRNRLSSSLASFGRKGEECVPEAADYGSKILYLSGMAHFRKGAYILAADTFRRIADRYPRTSLADDGLLHAGIALQEAEKTEEARAQWDRALAGFPTGDMVPEATWRLAWSQYLDGDPAAALEASSTLGRLPIAQDAVHVAAGRYWHARWLVYPDVEHPAVAVDDPRRRALAVAEWTALCEEMPHSFYAILGWSRLEELAPDVAEALNIADRRQAAGPLAESWMVRLSFLEDPRVQVGSALLRLGLVKEGLDTLGSLPRADLTGEEMAWLTELRGEAGDWLYAHDAMRTWLRSHPPGTLGPREAQVLRVAYPDTYFDDVVEAVGDYAYEARLLHALVREESNFNKDIVSHAGARGLTQLMPATAQEVARWMGWKVSTSQLGNPKTNLGLGARYLDALHRQNGGSPFLSLAAYNAGGGRVRQWLDRWGDVPTDEYVERIPFKETREYVKRLMGTWQTMRYTFDGGAAYPDLSAYNHHAMVDEAD